MWYSSVLTVTCHEIGRSTALVERTSKYTYRMHTGYLTRENRTNRILTHKKRSSTEHLYPVASVRSFKHVQNLLTDKTGQNGYYLTRKHSPHEELTRNECDRTRTDREFYCPLRVRYRYPVRCDSHLTLAPKGIWLDYVWLQRQLNGVSEPTVKQTWSICIT